MKQQNKKCIVCKKGIGIQRGGKYGFYVCDSCYIESKKIWGVV